MASKFFVTVIASNKQALLRLQDYSLDLFRTTAKKTNDQFTIEGLLSLGDIEKLAVDGYKVLVKEKSPERTAIQGDVVAFDQWIKAINEENSK